MQQGSGIRRQSSRALVIASIAFGGLVAGATVVAAAVSDTPAKHATAAKAGRPQSSKRETRLAYHAARASHAKLGGPSSRRHVFSGAYSSAVLADSPVGFWQLNETSGTTAADSSGNGRNGSYVNAPTRGVSGPITTESANTAVSLNGTSQRVTLTSLATPRTVEAWVKLSTNTGTLPVFSNRDGSSGHSMIFFGLSGGKAFVYVNTRSPYSLSGTTRIDNGAWHQIVYSWDGTTGKIYVDGALQTSAAQADGLPYTAVGSIGYDVPNGSYFPGSVDEVALYGSALTGTRIAAHYTAATTITAPSNVSPPTVSGSAQVGGTLTAATGSWDGPPTSYAYQWRRCAADGTGCADIAGATGQTYALVAAELGLTFRVVVTGSNSVGSNSASSALTPTIINTYRNIVLADSPRAYWRLDDTSGTTAVDASGNGLDASYGSGITLGSSGALGNDTNSAATFGTSSVVSRSIVTTQTAGVTLEAWIYWTGTSAASYFLYNGNAASNGFGLYVSNGSCGAGSSLYLLLGGSLCNGINSAGTVPTNQWTHVALTLETNNTFTIYVNGVAKRTGSANFVAPSGTTSVGNSFAGKIDEVAIYNTALSASRILAHYNAGNPGTWPVMTSAPTISGTTVEKWTLSANDGSWSGSPTFSHQWQRCDGSGSCSDIVGANAQTYTLTAGDVGKTIRAKVAAANSGGAVPAITAETSSIASLATVMPPAPTTLHVFSRGLTAGPKAPNGRKLGGCTTAEQDYNGPWITRYRWNCDGTLEFERRNPGGAAGGWYDLIIRCETTPGWPGNTCGNDSQSYDGIGGYLSFQQEVWDDFGPGGGQGAGKLVRVTCLSPVCFKRVGPGSGFPDEAARGDCDADAFTSNPTECDGDPVNGATGGFRYAATDLTLPGRGLPLSLARGYSSEDAGTGGFGAGWTFNYAAALAIQASGNVVVRAPTGQRLDMFRQTNGSYVAVAFNGAFAAVSGGYELTSKDQRVYHFNSGGVLQWVQERNGNRVALGYSGAGQLTTITDTVGRVVQVQTNSSGQITGFTLPDGRSVAYHYTNGQLTSFTDLRGGTTTYGYDTNGRLASIVDANNHTVVQTTYDEAGRVTAQTDANAKQTTFNWDVATQTLTATDARGNSWTDVYSNNKLVKRIDPLGNTTHYSYDTNFNLTSVADARGNTTTATFDTRGNALTVTAPAPLSYQQTTTYDAQNNPTSFIDGRTNGTAYGYDSPGNLTSITRPGGSTIQFARNPQGLITSVTNARGKRTTLGRDTAGNLTSISSPLGAVTTIAYDAASRPTSLVEPRGNVAGANPNDYTTTYTYDPVGNVLTATDPLGHQTSWTYDAAGNVTSRTDANSHTTTYLYDPANRLVSVTAPGGTQTSYTYDAVGNLLTKQDPNGHTTTFAYDTANQLTSVTTTNNKLWTFAYDANGNLTRVVDANGNATSDPNDGITNYSYDVLNRLSSISYSDGTPSVSYSYDAAGNRTSMIDGAGTQSYSYDALNRLTAVTRGDDSFGYAYDAAGEITQRTYPGRQTNYAYTDDSSLTTVTSGGATTSYTYDIAGNPVRVDLPAANGYAETRIYDRAGRLNEVRNERAGTTLSFADYVYDPVGNPIQITTGDGLAALSYDNRDRLTEVCYQASCPGGSDPFIRWAYDAVGNRTSEARPAGTTTYNYDAADELTASSGPAGTTNYTFDADGRQTQADDRSFAWNIANELVSTSAGSAMATYSYDGDGNRLSETIDAATTSFVWDVNHPLPQLALERDTSGTELRNHLYGLDPIGMSSGGHDYYFHRDGIGSIVNVTNGTGDTAWSYSYEPYGNVKMATQSDPSAPENPIRFAGEYVDATSGLINLRARRYNATSGSFLSKDPVAAALRDPAISSYAYADDRPTVFVDPSGMMSRSASDPNEIIDRSTWNVGESHAEWTNDRRGCTGLRGNLECGREWFARGQLFADLYHGITTQPAEVTTGTAVAAAGAGGLVGSWLAYRACSTGGKEILDTIGLLHGVDCVTIGGILATSSFTLWATGAYMIGEAERGKRPS